MLPLDHEAVLELLLLTPQRIFAASNGLLEAQVRRKPAADSWSAKEVLEHLMACADVWGTAIMAMLTEDRPTLRYVSPRTWIRKTDYAEQDFYELLWAFKDKRKELLEVLRLLREEEWLRGATIKAANKLCEETVFSYAQRMAQHEVRHCEQMERILGRRP